jgi:hypothetical protein
MGKLFSHEGFDLVGVLVLYIVKVTSYRALLSSAIQRYCKKNTKGKLQQTLKLLDFGLPILLN